MAEATVDAAPPEPAKKSKWMLIVVAVVLALIAGGAGAYFLAQRKPADAAADAKEVKAEPRAPALYVEFDPPFVVNFEARGMVRFLQVTIQVMTRDPEAAELIKKHDPRIRNDLLMLLGNQTYETISTREGKDTLRAQALQAVVKVVESEAQGAGKKIEDLYFTSFVMQ